MKNINHLQVHIPQGFLGWHHERNPKECFCLFNESPTASQSEILKYFDIIINKLDSVENLRRSKGLAFKKYRTSGDPYTS